ncbi:MAG: glycosyltransferase family 2 protein [Hyphomicrobiaceae bacterium]
MPEKDPCVSVVVPLYNTARYIDSTLQSILAQTFRDFEVVVVNDASSDEGPQIVAAVMERDQRVRMVTQDNRGLAGARNSGIRAARGRYIALLDADDLWHPEKLQRHVAHLEANQDVGVSYSPSKFIDDEGHELGLQQSPKLDGVDAAHVFCRNPVGNGSAPVIRRAALDEVAFFITALEGARECWFDESFRQSEDIEMWTRMAALTHWRFAGIPEALTYYRVNTGGLSADVEKQFESWSRMRDKIATIAPRLVAAHGQRAEAYQRRYLARRLVMNGEGRKALRYVWQGLCLHPSQLIEEPARTLATMATVLVLAILPSKWGRSLPATLGKLKGIPHQTAS